MVSRLKLWCAISNAVIMKSYRQIRAMKELKKDHKCYYRFPQYLSTTICIPLYYINVQIWTQSRVNKKFGDTASNSVAIIYYIWVTRDSKNHRQIAFVLFVSVTAETIWIKCLAFLLESSGSIGIMNVFYLLCTLEFNFTCIIFTHW